MKKTLIKLCSIAAIGLALTACNNDAANKAAIDSDNSAVDQLVQDKLKTLDDSLAKSCDDQVTLAANAKLEAEAPKGGTAHAAAHHTPKPAPAAPVKKEEPKGPAATGKANQANQNGTATGKATDAQKAPDAKPTGKRQ